MKIILSLLAILILLPAHGDKHGERILRKALKKVYAQKCLVADFEYEDEFHGNTDTVYGTVYLMKPNLMLFKLSKSVSHNSDELATVSPMAFVVFSDRNVGLQVYNLKTHTYQSRKVRTNPLPNEPSWSWELESFFEGEKMLKGTKIVSGIWGRVVKGENYGVQVRDKNANYGGFDLHINRKDGLIHSTPTSFVPETFSSTCRRISQIKFPNLKKTDLMAMIPKDFKLVSETAETK